MKVITATDTKNAFGELLMCVQSQPVSIARNGKEQGGLRSSREYAIVAIQDGRSTGIAGDLGISEIKRATRSLTSDDSRSKI